MRCGNTLPHSEMLINIEQGIYTSTMSTMPILYRCPNGHIFNARPIDITMYDPNTHCSEIGNASRQRTCPTTLNVIARFLKTTYPMAQVKINEILSGISRKNGNDKILYKMGIKFQYDGRKYDIELDSTDTFKTDDGSNPPRYENKIAQMVKKTLVSMNDYHIIRITYKSMIVDGDEIWKNWKDILPTIIENSHKKSLQINIVGESKYLKHYSMYVKLLRNYYIFVPVILYIIDPFIIKVYDPINKKRDWKLIDHETVQESKEPITLKQQKCLNDIVIE